MKKFFINQKFNPNFLSIFFHPFYFIRKDIFNFLKENSNYLYGSILDFGGGSKPYSALFKGSTKVISIEVLSDKNNLDVDVYYDGYRLPFSDNSFDSILCTEVLEHVEEIDIVIKELYRVIKPGGQIIITTPFMCIEHELPMDFRRFTKNGLEKILKKNNFNIIKSKKLVNNFNLIFLTINFYIYVKFISKYPKLKFFFFLFLVGPVNIISLFLNLFLPSLDEMYFGNGVIVKK